MGSELRLQKQPRGFGICRGSCYADRMGQRPVLSFVAYIRAIKIFNAGRFYNFTLIDDGIMVDMKKLMKQFFSFIAVSGVGFIIDFAVYYYLTASVGFSVVFANMMSAIPAITWVFTFSTRKIFQTTKHAWSIGVKYAVYLSYQAVLIVIVSTLAQWMYNVLLPYVFDIWLIGEYLNLVCKCMITPITMVCNFVVMKFLSERI